MYDSGRGRNPGHHLAVVASSSQTDVSLTESTAVDSDHRQRAARLAEETMPLGRYYRHHGGPLLAVPIGEFYVSGRWAS